MEFMKYTSIENSYRGAFINKIKSNIRPDVMFHVQEKIHGSNFSIWYNGHDFKFGKRTGFLQEGEDFFHYKLAITNELLERIASIHYYLDASTIVVYGELFGGIYPHKDVKKDNDAKAIQKGVYYSPSIHFFPFDIKVDGSFMDVSNYEHLFRHHGIRYIPSLFTGTLDECLMYSNEFQTTIPEMFNLPPIENNVCEGVVIKPESTMYLPNGERVIIKNKNSKFSESEKEPREKPIVVPMLPEEQELFDLMLSYMNDNRLRNVISKIGNVSEKDFGKLNGLFNQDILEDFIKDNGEKFNILEKESRKRLTKKLNGLTAELIRSNFLNIIDGEF